MIYKPADIRQTNCTDTSIGNAGADSILERFRDTATQLPREAHPVCHGAGVGDMVPALRGGTARVARIWDLDGWRCWFWPPNGVSAVWSLC